MTNTATAALGPGSPCTSGFEAYTILTGRGPCGVILLCDHASNALPTEYGTLGLPPEDLERHIAYDIGAADTTAYAAHVLGATAIFSCYSRLLIDCNRGADDPTLVMRLSDGTIIPRNRGIAADEIERRRVRFHEPYHAAIDREIDASLAAGIAPVLLSVHSFTESWKGASRPWHAAVLWDKDLRLAGVFLDGLRANGEFLIGDNEPYSGRLVGDTLYRHGTSRGLAHVIIEIRQDLLVCDKDRRAWGQRLASIMSGALADHPSRSELHSVRHYGSYAR